MVSSSTFSCLIQLTQNITDVNLDTESTKILLENSLTAFNSCYPFTNFTFNDEEFCIFFSNLLVLRAAFVYWESKENFTKSDYYFKEWQNYIQVKNTNSFIEYCKDKNMLRPPKILKI